MGEGFFSNMATIDNAFNNIVIPIEGVYSNDSGDSGGETVFGIARNIDKDFDWELIDSYKSKPNWPNNLNNDTVKQAAKSYYIKHYWDNIYLDKVASDKIAQEIFDSSLNFGLSIGGRFIQQTVNVLNKQQALFPNITVDGKIGPKTVEAINKLPDEKKALIVLNSLQGARYVELCENNERLEKFMYGWLNRVSL
jgi:lysozyme family protein